MDHVRSKRKPEVLEVNAYRADFLAIPAEGTTKDGITEMLPRFLGRSFLPKKCSKEACPALQDLFQAFDAVNRREFSL
jgi:hypothetical protein